MGRKRKNPEFDGRFFKSSQFYGDAILSTVVTRTEASELWGKALSTIDYQCLKGGLEYRKSITDSTVLISVPSLMALWGMPVDRVLWDLYDGEIDKDQILDQLMARG